MSPLWEAGQRVVREERSARRAARDRLGGSAAAPGACGGRGGRLFSGATGAPPRVEDTDQELENDHRLNGVARHLSYLLFFGFQAWRGKLP